jgi:hypothetical protein
MSIRLTSSNKEARAWRVGRHPYWMARNGYSSAIAEEVCLGCEKKVAFFG